MGGDIDADPRGKSRALHWAISEEAQEKEAITPGYMSGFGNTYETEALAEALPIGRNSPQKINYGLYAEQLSGSPFTAPHMLQGCLQAQTPFRGWRGRDDAPRAQASSVTQNS